VLGRTRELESGVPQATGANAHVDEGMTQFELADWLVRESGSKHVEQEKAGLNAAVGLKPAHHKIAVTRIEKFGRTECFLRMFHSGLNTICGGGSAIKYL